MSKEKRRNPRIGPVLMRADCHLGDQNWDGYLTSLSEGGAYLVTDEEVPTGETLSLYFLLPWQLGEIEAEAVVVYAISESDAKPEGYPAGVGLAFVSPSAEQVERLRRYVARFQEIAAQLTATHRGSLA